MRDVETFLKENFWLFHQQQLCELTGLSFTDLKKTLQKLGIQFKKDRDLKLKAFIQSHDHWDTGRLARRLNVSRSYVSRNRKKRKAIGATSKYNDHAGWLKENAHLYTLAEIKAIRNISPSAIYKYLKMLGLSYMAMRRQFAYEYIRKHYKDKTAKQIAQATKFSEYTIAGFASRLGFKKRVSAEIKKIIQQNPKTSPDKLAKQFGLSTRTVDKYRRIFGYTKSLRIWKQEAINFVMDNYRQKGNTEIAADLCALLPKERPFKDYDIHLFLKNHKLKRDAAAHVLIRKRNAENLRKSDIWKKLKVGDTTYYNTDAYGKIKMICIKKGKVVPYFRWLWEQHNGPLRKGQQLACRNYVDPKLEDLSLRAANRDDYKIAALLARNNKVLLKILLTMPDVLDLKRKEIALTKQIRQKNQNHDNRKHPRRTAGKVRQK